MKRGIVLLASLCSTAWGGAACQAVTHVRGAGAKVHAELLALVDSGFSGAVLVERHDTLLLEGGYGFANRERQIPFTPSTIAQIGSLTKQFTAVAIVDLAQRGKLHFDDSLASFVPDAPAQARAITIGQLLSHTSGLPKGCGDDFDRVSRTELLHRCLGQPLLAPPGEKFAYSNLGFSVLGAIVEQVTGTPLERYLGEHFLSPLRMTRTGYFVPGVSSDSFALGYLDGKSQGNILARILPLDSSFWSLKGNGGMQSTLEDMSRWYRALKAGPIITEAVRHTLFTLHARRDTLVSYGYGWFLRTDSLGRTVQVSQSGSDGVFVALWYWRPLEGTFIYTVTNFGENDLATRLVARIRSLLASPGP